MINNMKEEEAFFMPSQFGFCAAEDWRNKSLTSEAAAAETYESKNKKKRSHKRRLRYRQRELPPPLCKDVNHATIRVLRTRNDIQTSERVQIQSRASIFPKSPPPPPPTDASASPPLSATPPPPRKRQAASGWSTQLMAAARSSCTTRSRDICVYRLRGDVAFAEGSQTFVFFLPRAFCAAAALPPP